jgi:H+/Cl- antiporter ClcA
MSPHVRSVDLQRPKLHRKRGVRNRRMEYLRNIGRLVGAALAIGVIGFAAAFIVGDRPIPSSIASDRNYENRGAIAFFGTLAFLILLAVAIRHWAE